MTYTKQVRDRWIQHAYRIARYLPKAENHFRLMLPDRLLHVFQVCWKATTGIVANQGTGFFPDYPIAEFVTECFAETSSG